MVLCGRAAQRTHIKNIAVFFHPLEQIQVASGRFSMVTEEAEFTRLESELSFLQVKSTMTLQETIRQVKAEICENRRQIAHMRLESIAGAENPYSLMEVFGRGHLVTKNGATVYVTRCQPVEVTPRTHTNCTNEIPAQYNNTDVFVDPISFVIKAAAAPVRCNDIAPPRWRLNGRWYCAYPQIRDCGEPGRIPIKPVNIDDVGVMNLGLGRSIYSPEQLEEFKRFQESQGTRRAFLADSAERAYNSRVGNEWGSGLSGIATDSLIDAVGNHLVPMYRVIGPTAAVALLILFLVGVVRMLADIIIRAIAIARVRGCGWWLIGAFWGYTVSYSSGAGSVGNGERPHCWQEHWVPDGCRGCQDRRRRPGSSRAQPGRPAPAVGAQRAAQQLRPTGQLVARVSQQESGRSHLPCAARSRDARGCWSRGWEPRSGVRKRQGRTRIQPVDETSAPSQSGECAAHIGMGGMRIEKEPRQ